MHHPIINLPLGVEGINEILEALSARPYNRVADLINHIKAHAERQLQAAATAEPPAGKRPRRAKAAGLTPKRRGRPPGSKNKVVAIPAPAAEPVAEAA